MAKLHRVLVVGVGSIGERHLRCFQNTGRAELALCEVNASLRERVAQQYQITDAHKDLSEALSQGYDAVIICTPAHLHIPMAMEAVTRGMHLMLEKPVSTSLDGTDDLLAAISEHQVTASVAYVYRAHPALHLMRETVHSGRLGQPKHLTVVSGQHFPTYRPAYREIYYTRHETGGGAIQDALTHLVNAGEYLVGPVTRACCDAAHQVLEGVTVEDTVNVLARHGEVLASYAMNQFQAPNENTIAVHGDEASARFEFHRQCFSLLADKSGTWEEQTFGPFDRDTLFVNQANAFLDALEGRTPVACPIDEGLQTLRVNLALLQSAKCGQWVDIASIR